MRQFKIDEDVQELRKYIELHGCYSPEENLRIFDQKFAKGPRYLFQAVNRKYHLTDKSVCDVGCSYGVNLVHCNPDSYGIDVNEYSAKFARSLGLTVHVRDIMGTDVSDLPAADVVWCSALMEHVTSIHILLRKLHRLLKSDGLLALYVPTIPVAPWLGRLPKFGRYFRGHRYRDHINGFVPQTLRFFCERAGFRTVDVSPFYPGILFIFNHTFILNQVIDGCVYIGRKIDPWEYPAKTTRRVAQNADGFTFIGHAHTHPKDEDM